MKKRVIAWMMAVVLASASLTGCKGQEGGANTVAETEGNVRHSRSRYRDSGEERRGPGRRGFTGTYKDRRERDDFCDLCEVTFECAIDCGAGAGDFCKKV